ncbi:MAG: hypothetical protein RLZZ95_1540 [Pseudomonadota bacterium]|jgi:hypothetical protein
MSFFLTASSESWKSFWSQAAGNKALHESSFELFSKAVAQFQLRNQATSAPTEHRWSGSTVTLPSWSQMH